MSASLDAGNVLSYSIQVAVIVAAGALAPALLRLRLPRVMLPYWQALLVVAILLPVMQPRVPAPASALLVTTSQTSGLAGRSASPMVLEMGGLVVAGGIAFRLLRLAGGLLTLRRYRRGARPMAIPPAIDRLGARLGVRPAWFVSLDITAPATFGVSRPTILVPPRFREMREDLQVAVACHEMVHVQRRDWLCAVFEEVAGAVLWFHPAVWWLLGRIRLSREQLVDAEVVRLTGAPRAYLEALLDVARTSSHTPALAPLFLKESHLRQRVNLLLEEVSMSKRRMLAALGTSAVAVVLSVGMAVWAFPLEGPPVSQEPTAGSSSEPTQDGVASGERKGKSGPPRRPARSVAPVYPEKAKRDKVEGNVVLAVTVQKSGEVSDVQVVSGPDALTEAAVTAVKQWRYEPSDQGAKLTITIRFALDK